MVTLYKRANERQKKILRIIEGAVLNTMDAHGIKRDERLARSIAKRATGTLTAQWPEVLAGVGPSETGSATVFSGGAGGVPRSACRTGDRVAAPTCIGPRSTGGGSQTLKGRPGIPTVAMLSKAIVKQMWQLKRLDPERYRVMQEVLREAARFRASYNGN